MTPWRGSHFIPRHTPFRHTEGQFLVSNHPNMHVRTVGGNWDSRKKPTEAQEEHADSSETPENEPSCYEAAVSHSQLIKYLKHLNRSCLDNSASSGSAVI